jgi:D-tyrosyl-tRNA(Tyr) deacylase
VIGLLQRVSQAQVVVDGTTIAAIGSGLLVLVGVQRGDGAAQADRLLERLLGYRVFPDEAGRMNRSVREMQGALLLVPQFTLAADTRKGSRAGFSTAAEPQQARRWFEYLVLQARLQYARAQAGSFGADMQVALVNEGPVTFWLEVPPTMD